MTLGYLVPEFPNQTHAFFCREIAAIEEAGTPVRIYSTRRPAPGACPHDFAAPMTARTTYLFPPRLPGALRPLAAHPGRAARAAAYLAGLDETPAAGRARLAGLLPSAAMLAADARRHGVTHLHVHSCANAAHLAALALILGGPDYSLTLHGDLPVYGTDHAAKMRRARFVAAVTRPLAAQIAAVSPATPAPVLWMGVDCARFAPPAPRARAAGAPFTVATVARLNPTKGHRFFLEAMARLRDEGLHIRWRVAGDGPERAAIEARIAQLGLTDQVQLLGPQDEGGVLALLQEVDALALTSFGMGEAAPVTVMEAMACGLPVICSVIGGTADMICDGEDGLLVPQQDVAAIAGAVRRLAEDGDLARRIGAAARMTALREFDHRRNAARLLERIRAA